MAMELWNFGTLKELDEKLQEEVGKILQSYVDDGRFYVDMDGSIGFHLAEPADEIGAKLDLIAAAREAVGGWERGGPGRGGVLDDEGKASVGRLRAELAASLAILDEALARG